jgi:hypothetical protein
MDLIHEPQCLHDDGIGLSPDLWKNFPWHELNGPWGIHRAYMLWDDFASVLHDTTDAILHSRNAYRAYIDTTGTFAGLTTAKATGLVITPHTDAADAASIQALGTPFSVIHGSAKELIFEARFKIAVTTAGYQQFFIGLGGNGACADTGCIADNGAGMASNSFLGIGKMGAVSTHAYIQFQRAGGTASIATYDLGTVLTADTYLKAGFRYNPNTDILRAFINGAEVADALVPHAITNATPWPNAAMNMLCEAKTLSTGGALTLSWWACAQLR